MVSIFFTFDTNLCIVVPLILIAARLVGARHLYVFPSSSNLNFVCLINSLFPVPADPVIKQDLFKLINLSTNGLKSLSATSSYMLHLSGSYR